MLTIKTGFLAALLLLSPGQARAETVYKYRAPDGTVLYADRPQASVALKTFESRRWTPSAEWTRSAAAEIARYDARDAAEQSRWQQHVARSDRRVELARRRLELAKDQYASGGEPLAGERAGLANGRSRLGSDYFERQELARRAVSDAERRYADALARRRALP